MCVRRQARKGRPGPFAGARIDCYPSVLHIRRHPAAACPVGMRTYKYLGGCGCGCGMDGRVTRAAAAAAGPHRSSPRWRRGPPPLPPRPVSGSEHLKDRRGGRRGGLGLHGEGRRGEGGGEDAEGRPVFLVARATPHVHRALRLNAATGWTGAVRNRSHRASAHPYPSLSAQLIGRRHISDVI